MALASTAQTPDGYLHASFGGPMDVFSSGSADVIAIGDGTDDATELAALLKGPVGPAATAGVPNSPYRVAYEAGTAPNVTTGSVMVPRLDDRPVVTAPTIKDAAILPSKPVVDSQGKIDCSGSVSCHTDPMTNITTVTYPDGVIAIVQKINDLTVVAYKTFTEALPSEISSLLPPVPTATPPVIAAIAPTQVPAAAPTPEPEPVVTPPASQTAAAPADPGPPAPDVSSLDPSDNGPRLNVTTPSSDFSPGSDDTGTGTGTGTNVRDPKIPDLGKIKDAIGDLVKGPVGNAVEDPAASSTAESSTSSQTSDGGSPSSDDGQSSHGSQNSKSDKSDKSGGDDSDGS
jgi:hypothetical protein